MLGRWMEKIRFAPALLVLIICTLSGFMLGCVGHYVNFSIKNEPQPPRVIGQMPEDVIEIVSIVAPSEGVTVPVMRTESGDLVAHGFLDAIDDYAHQRQVHEACNPTRLAAIEVQAGEVIDCKQGVAVTDYCPSAIRTYAITPQGELWFVSQDRPCMLVAIFYGLLAAVPGLAVGLFVLAVRTLSRPRREVEA